MLGITLRIGAAYDDITTADGAVFDRSSMDRVQRHKLGRLVRDIYTKHLEGK